MEERCPNLNGEVDLCGTRGGLWWHRSPAVGSRVDCWSLQFLFLWIHYSVHAKARLHRVLTEFLGLAI